MSVGSGSYDGFDITMVAAADLSSYQYCAVYVSAAGNVNVQTTNNGAVLGVLQNTPAQYEEAIVRISGTSIVKVNEAVATVGTHLTVANAAGGKGEVCDAANEYYFAESIEVATAQNDLILCKIVAGHSSASEA